MNQNSHRPNLINYYYYRSSVVVKEETHHSLTNLCRYCCYFAGNAKCQTNDNVTSTTPLNYCVFDILTTVKIRLTALDTQPGCQSLPSASERPEHTSHGNQGSGSSRCSWNPRRSAPSRRTHLQLQIASWLPKSWVGNVPSHFVG